MPGFVEQVTHSDHRSGFSGKVRGQAGSAAPKGTRYWVQLLTSLAQVVSSRPKIGCTQGRRGREQETAFSIPKSMAGSLRHRRFPCFHRRNRFHGGGLQASENLLRHGRSAKIKQHKQQGCFPVENATDRTYEHNVSEGSTRPLVLVLMECWDFENGPSVPLGTLGQNERELPTSGAEPAPVFKSCGNMTERSCRIAGYNMI